MAELVNCIYDSGLEQIFPQLLTSLCQAQQEMTKKTFQSRINCRGTTASERSREARARKFARAGKLQDRTRARIKKCARKEKCKKTLKATYGYVENIKQSSESDSLSLRSAGLTRASSS